MFPGLLLADSASHFDEPNAISLSSILNLLVDDLFDSLILLVGRRWHHIRRRFQSQYLLEIKDFL